MSIPANITRRGSGWLGPLPGGCRRPRLSLAVSVVVGYWAMTVVAMGADVGSLCGIHWYATDGDVETMSGGRGVWIVENVNTWESPSAAGQKSKFTTAVSRGHTIIVRLQPRWGYCVPREGEMAAYLAEVVAVANSLKNQVHIWQIGNEMDNWAVEYRDGPLPANVYLERFKRIRAAIKTVASPLGEQMVLLGPPTSFSPYLGAMLSYLDVNEVDGLAIHCYGVTHPPAVVNSLLNFQAGVRQQLDTIDSARGGAFRYKPVFITEFDRCCDPASTESVSAQFLHSAFDWLDAWNSEPARHPIVTAVWFIYPDSGWDCYSLRGLKGGTRGQDDDVWDAFQHAAAQDYPAGTMQKGLIVRPTSFSHERHDLGTPAPDTLQVINGGVGTLAYTVDETAPWLQLSNASGSNSGEWSGVSLQYDFAGLGYGTYTVELTVWAPEAANSPIAVQVTVVHRARCDFDDDGDADQEDFGQFQACYSGQGIYQYRQECTPAKLDGDDDVDADDFTVFSACLSGPGVAVEPGCGFGP